MSLFSGGGAGGWVTSVLHEGGIVGAGSTARLAPPQHWFANAVRMHSGGFVGLNPSEVPAIPPTGRGSAVEIGSEERAEWGRVKSCCQLKVVNTMDAGEFLSHGGIEFGRRAGDFESDQHEQVADQKHPRVGWETAPVVRERRSAKLTLSSRIARRRGRRTSSPSLPRRG
jgi:hypothetical protein